MWWRGLWSCLSSGFPEGWGDRKVGGILDFGFWIETVASGQARVSALAGYGSIRNWGMGMVGRDGQTGVLARWLVMRR